MGNRQNGIIKEELTTPPWEFYPRNNVYLQPRLVTQKAYRFTTISYLYTFYLFIYLFCFKSNPQTCNDRLLYQAICHSNIVPYSEPLVILGDIVPGGETGMCDFLYTLTLNFPRVLLMELVYF